MKRSIPISEVLDTPPNFFPEWSSRSVGCRFDGCGGPVSEWFGGLQIFSNHGDAIANKAGVRAKRKRSAPATNRHGIPVYDRIQGRCAYPRCPLAVTTYQDMQLCDKHVHLVVDEVKRREPAKFVVVRTVRSTEPEPERKPAPTMGVVYYVQNAEHIKIGWTSDLAKRMRRFAPNSKLLATEPGTRKDETRLHRMFAVHRTHGKEWYAPVPSVLRHIEGVRARHGEPEQVVMGAKPVTIPTPRDPQYIGGTTKLQTGSVSRPLRG